MKRINLALQGGGAHGAFTWGVVDRILDEGDIEIAAISGTSAGALNGAAIKAGFVVGGRDAARENLNWLWDQMGATTGAGYLDWVAGVAPSAAMLSNLIGHSPGYQFADAASRVFSPYALGPAYRNPIERIARRFRYDKVCAAEGPRFFVCATNVRSGRIRVFTGEDINTKVLMASACLPTIFQAVEIPDPATGKKEAYWDGGYTGNPALFPLYDHALPDDIVVVNINPLYREDLPRSAPEIQNRINEIGFNTSLLAELRSIAFVKRLLAEGRLEPGQMKNVRVHMIADDDLMNDLSVATKMVPVPTLLAQLKEAGRAAADAFLSAHFDDLNNRDTLNLGAMFD
ncbi:patatin-like phospholipase family protein [Aliiroseovarius sp. YM-037]|uniref:patatin-like phospholipase family protein n=1 Tax=Aliiroseovarius sp. YM-037 TaxID=3341728 RepID=UPI003A80C493